MLIRLLKNASVGRYFFKRTIMTETCYYTKDGQKLKGKDEFLEGLKKRLFNPENGNKPGVLFLGENHADPEAHKLEMEILQTVHKDWTRLNEGSMCLSLEFYERDCQTVMDEYLKVRVKL